MALPQTPSRASGAPRAPQVKELAAQPLHAQRRPEPERRRHGVRGRGAEFERAVRRLPVAGGQVLRRGVGGRALDHSVPQVDLVGARKAAQLEPRERAPARLHDRKRALERLRVLALEEGTPAEAGAVARPVYARQDRITRRESQVARHVPTAGAQLHGGPWAHSAARPDAHPAIGVGIGRDNARGVRPGVAVERPCHAIVNASPTARDAEPVLPAQRGPERTALRQRIELLDEILYALARRLSRERAPSPAIHAVGVGQVHPAEGRGPRRRRYGGDPALDVRLPARRTRMAPLGVDQQYARPRPRAVHGGARRPTEQLHRFDVLRVEIVRTQRPDGREPASGLEVVLRLVHAHAVDQDDGRAIAIQRLHAAHADARSHVRQPGPGRDE